MPSADRFNGIFNFNPKNVITFSIGDHVFLKDKSFACLPQAGLWVGLCGIYLSKKCYKPNCFPLIWICLSHGALSM